MSESYGKEAEALRLKVNDISFQRIRKVLFSTHQQDKAQTYRKCYSSEVGVSGIDHYINDSLMGF